jgi:8-oxo-dGTP pyrophosphatase MutT (NUDIX family)
MSAEIIAVPDGSYRFWNLFASGCSLGTFCFKNYHKDYVYVLMPKSKAKVFLRCVIFLTIKGDSDKKRFAIVHRWSKPVGGPKDKNNWEPIKGQVEDKERKAAERMTGKEYTSLLHEILRYTIQREVEEEAKIYPYQMENLTFHPELGYTSRHTDYPEKNMYFQYNVFTAEIDKKDFEKAQEKLNELASDPRSVNLPKDEREKNALAIWSPRPLEGFSAIMGGTSSAIVRMYLRNIGKQKK